MIETTMPTDAPAPSNGPSTKDVTVLAVIGTFEGVSGRYFHLNSRTSVKLSNLTNAYICLSKKCIDSREANDCVHVSLAAKYHVAHPEQVAETGAQQ